MKRKVIRLAVVGAGPKAAAIAAKAEILNRSIRDGRPRLDIYVYEKTSIGANWDGEHGYTDGQQSLCTASDRDVGFPYSSVYPETNNLLSNDYSWTSFNLNKSPAYARWVDRNRPIATHETFAKYLQWVITKATELYIPKEVIALHPEGNKWSIRIDGRHRLHQNSVLYDGVVVTGPGSALQIKADKVPANLRSRVFNGDNFWSKRDQVDQLIGKSKTKEIVIIGGGVAAAAIISWLVRNGHAKTRIYVIANQATIYTRVESAFENILFSDTTIWENLSPESRSNFFNRVNRGVVWSSVVATLNKAEGLIFMDGRATEVVKGSDANLEVIVKRWNESTLGIGASIVIDATGFDGWWFRRLLYNSYPESTWKKRWLDCLADEMGESLEFTRPYWTLPPLHAPMLSKARGPGYASLMVLGNLSDAILSYYAPPQGP